jgi:hypothetical protein
MNPFLHVLRGLPGSRFWGGAPVVAFACASVLAAPLGAQDGRGNASRSGGAPRVSIKVPYAGLRLEEAPKAFSHHFPIPSGFGLLVTEVMDDSPAADAGIQRYDVLLRSSDQRLVNPGQFNALMRARKPGETLSLTVFRAGKEWEVDLTLWEAEETQGRVEEKAGAFRNQSPQPAPKPPQKVRRPAGPEVDLSKSAAFSKELLQKNETLGDEAMRKFREIEPFQFLSPPAQPSGQPAQNAVRQGPRQEGPPAR